MQPYRQYTANATATGAGRDGTVNSNGLKLNLALSKELGGSGKGENPEQLFAMGYSGIYMRLRLSFLPGSDVPPS